MRRLRIESVYMTNKKFFSKNLVQRNRNNQKIIYSLDFQHRTTKKSLSQATRTVFHALFVDLENY